MVGLSKEAEHVGAQWTPNQRIMVSRQFRKLTAETANREEER